ncbi:sulfite exporter TauE/SafE family protein [Agrilactobacillus composti]|nr:sulfite exporter TauE/SafE family protein [Agrilactobacillus composti]
MSAIFSSVYMLVFVGIAAGILSSVVGMASLISYPFLLAIGLPPLYANVTNTAGLIFTGVGVGLGSRKELHGHGRDLLKILVLTITGSVFGSFLLLIAPASTFEHVVPFFIATAGVLLLMPSRRDRDEQIAKVGFGTKRQILPSWLRLILYGLSIFLVGAYTGYFGAAGGVIMLAIFSITSDEHFPVYNAIKNITLCASNMVGTVIYSFESHIYWHIAIPLGIGLAIGGYIGPAIVRRVPARPLKIVISLCAFGLAVDLFIKAFF